MKHQVEREEVFHEMKMEQAGIEHHHEPHPLHRFYMRHVGHWFVDFPKTSAVVVAGFVILLFLGIMLLIRFNSKPGVWPLWGG